MDRLTSLLNRIYEAEKRVDVIEARQTNPVGRVKAALLAKSIYSGKFVKVQPGYYDLTLDARAGLLKCIVPQLCKSIIFENTMHDSTVINHRTNSKFYCVITQYTGNYLHWINDCLIC